MDYPGKLCKGGAGMIKRPVLRYHGGKWILAPWIIKHFPAHEIYTEVFGGAGNVLMRKPRSKAEVYNDLGGYVVNVFRVLRDKSLSEELIRRLKLTPFSRDEYEFCSTENYDATDDIVEKARMTIVRSFLGFGSGSSNHDYSTGFRPNSHRNGTGAAVDWKNYAEHVPTFTKRLSGVVIENKNYADVLVQHDHKTALHYVDPPYLFEVRKSRNKVYEHEMTVKEHGDMAKVLKSLKGMVVISGYESDLYGRLFKSFICVKRKHFADRASERVECLWLNKAAAKNQSQISLQL
jgi:DNA adenine methylase